MAEQGARELTAVYAEASLPAMTCGDGGDAEPEREVAQMPRPVITVYDPTAEPRPTPVSLAKRLTSLRGARAGILDNGKANAGVLMLAVVERMRAAYGVGEVVKREKPVAGPPSPEVLRDLSRCDFVLVGSSD